MLGRAKEPDPSGSEITDLLLLTPSTAWGEGSLSRQRAPWGAREGLPALLPPGPCCQNPLPRKTRAIVRHMRKYQGSFDTLMLTSLH